MTCNMGKTDRVLRGIVGAFVIIVGLIMGSWWGLVGLPLVGTAILGYCPAYKPLKITTCKK